MCLPVFSLAEKIAEAPMSFPVPIEVTVEEMVANPKVDPYIQMYCVWTTCTGTICDEKFSDDKVAIDFIDKFDHCYD
ncbi:Uncharacterised protein [Porphyromonas macacae]|uniref:Uncharacterized protein n=2 Tax=Porphyromonas macacae TaxID=28115 RepID=A0A379DJF0_9PORP|nr:Uncharacterised protein [Porphyromonas macacae]